MSHRAHFLAYYNPLNSAIYLSTIALYGEGGTALLPFRGFETSRLIAAGISRDRLIS